MTEKLKIPGDYGKVRGLKPLAEAKDLVTIGTNPEGREIRLSPQAARAWRAMRQAALKEGIALVAISGFRSVERQTQIIRAKLGAGESIESILRTMAAPGYSEHHTGRAIDLAVPEERSLTEDFGNTAAFAWLSVHAAQHGFRLSFPKGNVHGIAYEPWHWCFMEE